MRRPGSAYRFRSSILFTELVLVLAAESIPDLVVHRIDSVCPIGLLVVGCSGWIFQITHRTWSCSSLSLQQLAAARRRQAPSRAAI